MITSLMVKRIGLISGDTGLSQLMETDLTIIKPKGTIATGEFVNLLLEQNVLEFKSQGDPFDKKGFSNAVSRAFRYAAQNDIPPHEVLNIVVTAREPEALFEYLAQQGSPLQNAKDEGRPWLWRGKIGPQPMLVIVLRLLPLQEEWYDWLAFAPSDSKAWRELVRKMLREGNDRVVEILQALRPEEFAMEKTVFQEAIEAGMLTSEEIEEVYRIKRHSAKITLRDMRKRPAELQDVLTELTPEERLSGLKPEELLAGLGSEEQAQLLKLLSQP